MMDLKTLEKNDFKYVCGVDEAGRGPLAGPMSVSFFVVPIKEYEAILNPFLEQGLNDSKKMSEKKREVLFDILPEEYYFNEMVAAREIDDFGISECMQILIKRLLGKISDIEKTYFFLDGAIKFPKSVSHEVIIGGDGKEPTIMAASVTAKVLRDRKMRILAKKYPEYELETHKGYGTVKHRAAIKKHGCSEIHRITFCKNIF